MAGAIEEFRVAMWLDKWCNLLGTTEGSLQYLIENVKDHVRSKVEHSFSVIKQQFGVQKTRLRGLAKNPCKINVLAALKNLFLVRLQLFDKGLGWG